MWAVNLLVALAVIAISSLVRAVRQRRRVRFVSYHRLGVSTIRGPWKPRVGVVVVVTSPNLARPLVLVTDEKGRYELTNLAPGDYTITHVFPDGSPTETKLHHVGSNGRWIPTRA